MCVCVRARARARSCARRGVLVADVHTCVRGGPCAPAARVGVSSARTRLYSLSRVPQCVRARALPLCVCGPRTCSVVSVSAWQRHRSPPGHSVVRRAALAFVASVACRRARCHAERCAHGRVCPQSLGRTHMVRGAVRTLVVVARARCVVGHTGGSVCVRPAAQLRRGIVVVVVSTRVVRVARRGAHGHGP